jgi:hypothetical protein
LSFSKIKVSTDAGAAADQGFPQQLHVVSGKDNVAPRTSGGVSPSAAVATQGPVINSILFTPPGSVTNRETKTGRRWLW